MGKRSTTQGKPELDLPRGIATGAETGIAINLCLNELHVGVTSSDAPIVTRTCVG